MCIAATTAHFFTAKRRMYSIYRDKEDYIHKVIGSCSAPWIIGTIHKVVGCLNLSDGGFTNWQPIVMDTVKSDNITISCIPFSDTDVHPTNPYPLIYLVSTAFKPPSEDNLDWYFDEGYYDLMSFVKENKHRHHSEYAVRVATQKLSERIHRPFPLSTTHPWKCFFHLSVTNKILELMFHIFHLSAFILQFIIDLFK